MIFIYLSGETITLKSFTREEFHCYFSTYVSDPVMDAKPFKYTRANVDHGYDLMCKRQGCYELIGIFLKDGTPIGDLSFRNINQKDHSATIGIALGMDQYKGKGYGSESFRLGLQYAFSTLQLKLIYGDTLSSNIRMQRLFDSCHFIHYETFRHFTKREGRWEDRYHYLLRNV